MFEYLQQIRSKEYHSELIQQGEEERMAKTRLDPERRLEDQNSNTWNWENALISLIFRRSKHRQAESRARIQAKLN
jgi:hypothetical protein